jgi:hypothetical protein
MPGKDVTYRTITVRIAQWHCNSRYRNVEISAREGREAEPLFAGKSLMLSLTPAIAVQRVKHVLKLLSR